jgi:hypothetical protein
MYQLASRLAGVRSGGKATTTASADFCYEIGCQIRPATPFMAMLAKVPVRLLSKFLSLVGAFRIQ